MFLFFYISEVLFFSIFAKFFKNFCYFFLSFLELFLKNFGPILNQFWTNLGPIWEDFDDMFVSKFDFWHQQFWHQKVIKQKLPTTMDEPKKGGGGVSPRGRVRYQDRDAHCAILFHFTKKRSAI